MNNIGKKIIYLSFLLLFCLTASAIDIYIGNLGSFDSNTENLNQIQDISSRLQINLLKLNNDAITYKLIYTTTADTSQDYEDTIVDSKLNALGVSIFYNVNYVLFGSVYIDPETNLYTCFIKVYDKARNSILYETNYSKIIGTEDKAAYTSALAEQLNSQLYFEVTGKKYEKPQPGVTPGSADANSQEAATTRQPENDTTLRLDTENGESTEETTADSNESGTEAGPDSGGDSRIIYDDEVMTYLKQILGILNQAGLAVPQGNLSESTGETETTPTPTPTPTPIPTPTTQTDSTLTTEPTPTPVPSPVLDLILEDGPSSLPAAGPVDTRKQISLINSAGYPFLIAGKWKGPLLPVISLEEGLKFHITLVNNEDFRFALRPALLFNYSFGNRTDLSWNYVIRYHSFTPKVGLDAYFEFKESFGLYLGGGGEFKYNIIDFRNLSYRYYTDIEYAPGFYAELGFELLLNNSRSLGLGINNVLDWSFFHESLIDYKAMLMINYRL